MKEPLGNENIIYAPVDMECDICGDKSKCMIYDHYHGEDMDLCIDCYVHRYGVENYIKYYGWKIG